MHKMSSVLARRMRALYAKLCVRYFRHDYNTINFDFILIVSLIFVLVLVSSLQCFDAIGWVAGRASGL